MFEELHQNPLLTWKQPTGYSWQEEGSDLVTAQSKPHNVSKTVGFNSWKCLSEFGSLEVALNVFDGEKDLTAQFSCKLFFLVAVSHPKGGSANVPHFKTQVPWQWRRSSDMSLAVMHCSWASHFL